MEGEKLMEWKILEGNPSDVQKTLNQWKHMYQIHIHGYSTYGNSNNVSVLVTRERKEST